MKIRFIDRLLPKLNPVSWLKYLTTGSLLHLTDVARNTDFDSIKTQIDTMRALAKDSQISTALSYYATDATTLNTSGQVIWASPKEPKDVDVANIINDLFLRWDVVSYARAHILELATIGNLYIPTTDYYKPLGGRKGRVNVALDHNTIIDTDYDIIASTKIPPEDVIHVWEQGKPKGFYYKPSDVSEIDLFPESSIIHFSLGGLLGDYKIMGKNKAGDDIEYDIQFAEPLLAQAVQPTQALSLLEDAIMLSSLARTVKFINVEVGNQAEDDEVRDALRQVKDTVEQQLSINTASGDTQSYVNPQSPNNLIFVPKINGQDPISITDLNMTDSNEADSKLLTYYQDKKLSVSGVPKEAMNFSSNEGLGGAGAVLSQRSAIYANALQRIETAYMAGWRKAINYYFTRRNLSGYVDRYELHMQPIVTTLSTVTFEKRSEAINQAQTITDLMKNLGITDDDAVYKSAITEILSEVLPKTGSNVSDWGLNIEAGAGDEGGF
jgi:hypothetical protein